MPESGLERHETSSSHPKDESLVSNNQEGTDNADGAAPYGTLDGDEDGLGAGEALRPMGSVVQGGERVGGAAQGVPEGGLERTPVAEQQTYVFSSVPSTPKDKPADILVRFQAISRENPAVEVKAVYISSRCTLLETRRILHKFFR